MSAIPVDVHKPTSGSFVEFWCHRMSMHGKPGTGIRGLFREGRFWSHDNADHWSLNEVACWNYLRN